MKRVLVAVLACAALGAWGQVESNAEWELVSQSAKTDTKYFYKKSSETTSVKNGRRVTTGLFSKSSEGSLEMMVISVPHRDCVAKYGTFNVSRINDRSSGFESEFAFGRPERSVADGVASHLCKLAWDSQIMMLIQKKKNDVDYSGSVEMQKLFDSFLQEVTTSPARGNKDIEDLLQDAHQMVMERLAKK